MLPARSRSARGAAPGRPRGRSRATTRGTRSGRSGPAERVGEREVRAGEVLAVDLGLGQAPVLVVALEQREPQRAGRVRRRSGSTVAARDDDHDRDERDGRRSQRGPRSVRPARTRSASRPLTATTTNVASGTPPQLASARPNGKSCSATPTWPHANPPSGQRVRNASNTTHTAAVSNGERIPRRPSAPTTAPAAAQNAACSATNGTIATRRSTPSTRGGTRRTRGRRRSRERGARRAARRARATAAGRARRARGPRGRVRGTRTR